MDISIGSSYSSSYYSSSGSSSRSVIDDGGTWHAATTGDGAGAGVSCRRRSSSRSSSGGGGGSDQAQHHQDGARAARPGEGREAADAFGGNATRVTANAGEGVGKGSEDVSYPLPNRESISPRHTALSSIPFSASVPSSSLSVDGAAAAPHAPSRRAPPPQRSREQRVSGEVTLMTPCSEAAPRVPADPQERAGRAQPMDDVGVAGLVVSVSGSAEDRVQASASSHIFSRTESPSPLRRGDRAPPPSCTAMGHGAADGNDAATSPDTTYGPLPTFILGGASADVDEAPAVLLPRSPSVSTASRLPPPPLPQLVGVSSGGSSGGRDGLPLPQPLFQLPSRSMDLTHSFSSASRPPPPPLPQRVQESPSGTTHTAATSSNSHDRDEPHSSSPYSLQPSPPQLSSARLGASSELSEPDEEDPTARLLRGLSGARPPSQAPAPRYPAALLPHGVPPAAAASLSSEPRRDSDSTRTISDSAEDAASSAMALSAPIVLEQSGPAREGGLAEPPSPSPAAPSGSGGGAPQPSHSPPARPPALASVPAAAAAPFAAVSGTASDAQVGERARQPRLPPRHAGLAAVAPPHPAPPLPMNVAPLEPAESEVVDAASPPPLPPAPWRGGGGTAASLHPTAHHTRTTPRDVGDGTRRVERHRDTRASATQNETEQPRVVVEATTALQRWRSHTSLFTDASTQSASTTEAADSPAKLLSRSSAAASAEATSTEPGKGCYHGATTSAPQPRHGLARAVEGGLGRAADAAAARVSPFKGGVDFVRWVPASVDRQADLSSTAQTPSPPPPAPRQRRSDAHDEVAVSPRVVAVPLVARPPRTPPREASTAAVLAEVAHRYRVTPTAGAMAAGNTSSSAGLHRPSTQRTAASPVSPPSRQTRVRLCAIASPEQDRRASRAARELVFSSAAAQARRTDGHGGQSSVLKHPGEMVHDGDAHPGGAGRHAHAAFRAVPIVHHTSATARGATPAAPAVLTREGEVRGRLSLAAALSTRTNWYGSCSSSSDESAASAGDSELGAVPRAAAADAARAVVARTWRPLTPQDLAKDVVRRYERTAKHHPRWRPLRDTAAATSSADAARRWEAPPHHLQQHQEHSAAATVQGSAPHPSVLSIEGSSLGSSPTATALPVGGVAPMPASAWTGQGQVKPASSLAAPPPPPRSASSCEWGLAPGHAALYSPRLLATRVLEVRDTLLGAAYPTHAAAVQSATLHGSRAVPAVGGSVAAAADNAAPAHLYLDLTERSRGRAPTKYHATTTAAAFPAATSIGTAPWSLYLSDFPNATHDATALDSQARCNPNSLQEESTLAAVEGAVPQVACRIPLATSGPGDGPKPTSTRAQASYRPLPSTTLAAASPNSAAADTAFSTHSASVHANPSSNSSRARPTREPSRGVGETHDAVAHRSVSSGSGVVPPGTTPSDTARHTDVVTSLSPVSDVAPTPVSSAIRQGQPWDNQVTQAGAAHNTKSSPSSVSTPMNVRVAQRCHVEAEAAVRQVRHTHILAQQRLLQEESFRRRQITMQEDHRFRVELTELNYLRAVDYVRQTAVPSSGEGRPGHGTVAAVYTTGEGDSPLVGLQRVQDDQAAMAATLQSLAYELAALSP